MERVQSKSHSIDNWWSNNLSPEPHLRSCSLEVSLADGEKLLLLNLFCCLDSWDGKIGCWKNCSWVGGNLIRGLFSWNSGDCCWSWNCESRPGRTWAVLRRESNLNPLTWTRLLLRVEKLNQDLLITCQTSSNITKQLIVAKILTWSSL